MALAAPLVPPAEPKIVGLSLPEVLVLVHAFSEKQNTTAESSKDKDLSIRFIRRFVYPLRRKKRGILYLIDPCLHSPV